MKIPSLASHLPGRTTAAARKLALVPVPESSVTFSMRPGDAAWVLGGVFGLLLLAHGFVLLMDFGFGHGLMFGVSRLFNMGLEGSVPTLFASLLLLINALLFFVLFRVGEAVYGRHVWLMLSLVFCFLAVDEYAVLHERLIEPVRTRLGVGGYFYFAWIIPYALAVALLALIVLPSIWRLGWRYRFLFSTSALVYLSGAVGVEMLGADHYEAVEEKADLKYRLFQTVEESLEFIGLIILTFTLLDLLRKQFDRIVFRLS
jgi:hypothetical protein